MSAENRRTRRHRCKIRAQVRAGGKNYVGYVVDLSESGMRLHTDEVADIWTGGRVEVCSAELGTMSGIVRWRSPGRLGIKFDESSNTRAKFEAFQRNFMSA